MKYRMMFTKKDEAKYISHLDLNRIFERACRRAGLPLAFSQGFNPHPKISFAIPLAVGVAGEREFMELELTDELASHEVAKRLNEKLPAGIKMLEARVVEDKQKPLMARVNRATYRIVYSACDDINEQQLAAVIKKLMDKTSIEIERVVKGKTRRVDIRPNIYALDGQIVEGKIELQAELGAGTNGNVKPEELIRELEKAGLHVADVYGVAYRTGIFSDGDQGKVELW
jgi:radical SAM-linked protein